MTDDDIELARLGLSNAMAKALQPRVPSGPKGGQWTSGGGGGGGGAGGKGDIPRGDNSGIRVTRGRGDVSFRQDKDTGTAIGRAHTEAGKAALEAEKPATALGAALMKPLDAYKFTLAARKRGLDVPDAE